MSLCIMYKMGFSLTPSHSLYKTKLGILKTMIKFKTW